ncbi:MAG: DUF6174 domain-containing protein [Myxococcota bacterium]
MRTIVSLLGVGCLLVAAIGCAKGEPLTLTAIQDAQARWEARGLHSYRMVLEIDGDLIDSGRFEVEVRHDKITRLTRNQVAVASRDPFYTVDGFFKFLRDELEMAADPARYWQASPGTNIHQRAHFHAWGYPTRYLRAVVGTKQNITVVVKDVQPLEAI